ncbi:hypothetical protein T484DRAFT_1976224 [Baffinella frigidus]|nr:hypothetical protein T484DRAFT_1976224 [Cryptophyta sp. CCMP2293]|eukprot:CAMPEP_0180122640 /NCGR_PEP_ID=MMETSP0986-20121125/3682_1 /TAXON_ID=697907 /ORGANISM="non described non described, Strain CCMP2293" /LENGTH=194 /DNA_ID=CAMNT_0022061839 /DNA_START=31 /DNA_END=618 /DNA_ORIENTATION=-
MARLFLIVAASLLASTHGFMPSTTRVFSPRRMALATVMTAEPNPVVKILSAGMGLAKPLFGVEAKLQAAVLGRIVGYTMDEAVADINEAKASNDVIIYTYALSPFSTEAVNLLESTGYAFTKVQLGLEWFTLGGKGSQKRVALGDMVPNGGTSLPKIFIGGAPLTGASGYSALAEAVEEGTLEGLLQAANAKRA